MSKKTSLQQMHVLANSIRRTYNRLRYTTDQIHQHTELSAPKRTLLLDIDRDGPQTVPVLAAVRSVSRQIVQIQVNELSEAGYLIAKENPLHKRSLLIALTSRGRRTVGRLIESENAFIAELGWLPDSDDIKTCCRVLDSIYDKLE
ncbi:MAG TPA: hypothetical protein DCX06_09970 [Opitutae bacterium]|nr:hypothetical protein [Opitutae bacterium]